MTAIPITCPRCLSKTMTRQDNGHPRGLPISWCPECGSIASGQVLDIDGCSVPPRVRTPSAGGYRVVEVTGCGDCEFVAGDPPECVLTQNPLDHDEWEPPNWCPLRAEHRGPMLVRLRLPVKPREPEHVARVRETLSLSDHLDPDWEAVRKLLADYDARGGKT